MSEITKEEVVLQIQEYEVNMYRLAFAVLHNQQDAEDAVGEAVLRVLERYETLRKRESFRIWMMRIVLNEAKKIYGRNKKNAGVEWDDNLSPFFYDDYHELWDAVMQLDDCYRDVVILFYYERFTLEEIGSILDCKTGTVKSRLFRAKKQLRDIL